MSSFAQPGTPAAALSGPFYAGSYATATPNVNGNAGDNSFDNTTDLNATVIDKNYANNVGQANSTYGTAQGMGSQAAAMGYNTLGNAAQMMSGVANGTGPSAADIAMRNGMQQNNAMLQSAALSQQNGLAPGLTQRNMLQAQAQGNANIAAQGAQAKAQEQLNAMNGLGQVGGQMAGIGSNQAIQGAGGQSQNAANLLNAQTQQYGIQQGNDIHGKDWLNMGTQLGGSLLNGMGGGMGGAMGGKAMAAL